MRKSAFTGLLLVGLASPAMAQTPPSMVGAHDPASIVAALKMGGYKAELDTDGSGDPMISTEFAQMPSYIHFYGCNAEHVECTSLMFATGFDRETEWDAASAIEVSKNLRFAAIWLDDEGDPFISWDVVTGREGVPVGTFSTAVRMYVDTVDSVADIAFAQQRGE